MAQVLSVQQRGRTLYGAEKDREKWRKRSRDGRRREENEKKQEVKKGWDGERRREGEREKKVGRE